MYRYLLQRNRFYIAHDHPAEGSTQVVDHPEVGLFGQHVGKHRQHHRKISGSHFVKETPLKVIITQLTPNRRASGCKGYVTTMGPAAWARHPSPNTLLLRTSASLSLTPATSTGSSRLDSRPATPLPPDTPARDSRISPIVPKEKERSATVHEDFC